MKKYIILAFSLATALLMLASCSQSLLDIPKKGVVAYDDFYDGSEENAESAALAAYAAGIKCMNLADLDRSHWNIAPANFVLRNAPSDDTYYGSGNPGDHIFGLEINEYRPSFGNNSSVIVADYKAFYQWIYACNLMLDNFAEATGSGIARNLAEVRVLRALAHLHLAIYWGNPPKMDHVMPADFHPTNCDHKELLDWCREQFAKTDGACWTGSSKSATRLLPPFLPVAARTTATVPSV